MLGTFICVVVFYYSQDFGLRFENFDENKFQLIKNALEFPPKGTQQQSYEPGNMLHLAHKLQRVAVR